MNKHFNSLALLASLAMAGSATAATTISYSYQTIADSSVTSWVIPAGATSVKAMNMGSGVASTNFGGGSWLTTNPVEARNYDAPIQMIFHHPNVAWAPNFGGFYSGDASGILTTGNFGSASTQLDLNGFTVGQEYLVQFVLADTRPTEANRTITIDGYSANIAGQDSAAYTYAYADGRFAVVTARFTPQAGDTDFSFRPLVNGGDFGVQVNAVHILTVPEPSAALLGGLGLLALLRRRRA